MGLYLSYKVWYDASYSSVFSAHISKAEMFVNLNISFCETRDI